MSHLRPPAFGGADLLSYETKRVALGVTDAPPKADADGFFQGYAAIFDAPDQGGDVIVRGAFQKALSTRSPSAIKMLWQHDPADPVGVWLTLREDARGLFATGRLTLGARRGADASALMNDGALDGLSIGYRPTRAEKISGGRKLLEIDLMEISLVTFPMAEAARVSPSGAHCDSCAKTDGIHDLGRTIHDLGRTYDWAHLTAAARAAAASLAA